MIQYFQVCIDLTAFMFMYKVFATGVVVPDLQVVCM